MIYASVKDGGTAGCPAAVCRALAWLKDNDIRAMEPGKHPIEGEDMYVMVQSVTTHPAEGSKMEAHTKYIDLMYWPEAGERIGVARLRGGEVPAEDHPEGDFKLFDAVADEFFIHTAPGDFCVLFPADAHRPCVHPDGVTPVSFRKAVVKIAVGLVE